MKKSIRRIVEEFIEPYKRKKNVVGIVLSGSYAYGEPKKNSDIDIHIILEDSSYRMRSNTWRGGYEIEYFINPINQIEQYFKDEVENKSTSEMLSYGEILYEKDSRLRELITKAKKNLNKKVPKLRKKDVNEFRYSLDDIQKDIDDVQKDKASRKLLEQKAIETCIKAFFGLKQKPVPKKKYLLETVRNLDKKFYLNLKDSLEKETTKSTIKLINHVETLLGGKRPKEFIAKTSLTVN